jgi:hypothetical protein
VIAKLLLLSVVIMTVAIPIFAARDASPRRGLKRALFYFLVFNVAYLLAVRYLYPHLL